MAKGFYISKAVAVGAGVLALAAAATVVALAVVYAQEKNKNEGSVGPDGPGTTVPSGPGTDGPSGPGTTVPSGLRTSAPLPAEPWQRYRLPTSLQPLHYQVSLWPRLEPEAGSPLRYFFTGSCSVLFHCQQATDMILLHSNQLTRHGPELTRVWDQNEKLLTVKNNWLEKDTQYLVIILAAPLTAGKNYSLFIEFEGPLADDLKGFYRSQYKDETGQTRIIATTQMQPTDARKAFPCFDEPAMKATFTISLLHEPKNTALSNMPILENKNLTINNVVWTNTTFETTPKMSTYLLAFIVCDFGYIEQATDKPLIRIWARKQAINEGQGNYALNVTGPILTFFAKYYRVAYPLPKSDQIALPDFNAGAMENWGLVTYRETALLYDPKVSSNGNKERVVKVIAHELAHQWFGNLVTVKWWNDLWLNEGFASYVEYLGADFVEPKWNVKDLTVLDDVYRVFAIDALASSHPLSSKEDEVNTPAEINELFDAITYSKGAAVLRMLSDFLTEPIFVNGLSSYLTEFSYGNTVYDDLFDHLQKAAEGNVTLPNTVHEIMSRWTLQMGFPVVTIDTITGIVKQNHFLLDPNSTVTRPSNFNYVWFVPIRWMKRTTVQDLTWLMKSEDTIQEMSYTADNWILANLNVVGYYRVNYDERNWNNLVKQLNNNHEVIPVINRGQIIADSFNLARAQYRTTTAALNTTSYLHKEREYIPWQAALDNLAYIRIMFDRSGVFGNMEKYLLQQVSPLYDYFANITGNWTTPSEGHMDQYNEIVAMSVACSYGHQDCQNKAQVLFKQWMSNNSSNPIPLNLKSTVYCNAIALGGEEQWDFAWKMFKEATIATESDTLRYALACTKTTWLLNRYLEYTLQPDMIRKQDATSTISAIARNVVGQSLAWDFIRAQWSFIFQQYGGGSFSFSSLISSVTERFSTEFELSQLKQFQKDNEHIGFGSGSRALEQAMEKTKANIKWVAENKIPVNDWFINAVRQSP
ncbi:aminopeptidase Ey-like isoform X2 [Leucoraja erinacea]|uniref:aminopeptidase Ey-like isoform X2 n=2 Tax=Leucoraja erinaceus TaxID=7782 RepID=UPI0024560C8C|nr:aminopeptidase Ey-like isoform X2 [Leucoraja erinacea]